jgi:hypothetical protein
MRIQCQQVNLQKLYWQPRYISQLANKQCQEKGRRRRICKHKVNKLRASTLVHEYGFNAKVGRLPLYLTMLNCRGPKEEKGM